MTLRRLNLRIQGFPESYANEPYGEDMVVGEPHLSHPPMTIHSPLGDGDGGDDDVPHDMLNLSDDGALSTHPSHDPAVGMLGSPIRSSPLADDLISGAA
jgi:hypothetical protein